MPAPANSPRLRLVTADAPGITDKVRLCARLGPILLGLNRFALVRNFLDENRVFHCLESGTFVMMSENI